ncbi:hypothetical protein F5Y17DRAFT_22334 [Xylariaceae sp. FL0594]|nr:hypothetical protein F5Y17DRAFT_22334 [Xylariaceae sp. FL0594]
MQFHSPTALFTVLATLAALTSALPAAAPAQNNDLEHVVKRVSCPPSSKLRRDTAEEEAQGDDTPGAIIACDF